MSEMSKEDIDKLNKNLERMNGRLGLGYGFLHGVFAGLGTTIGVAVILGILGFLLQQVIAPRIPGVQDNLESILQSLDQVKK